MISLRTKDEVTHAASSRLFALGSSPGEIVGLTEEMISNAIYPAGFYKTKAANIRRVCEIIEREHGGTVPDTIEELVSLPGVGRKTANLVLGLGFGKDAICVDTHVHRIANRGGWVATRSPDETEYALGEILPRKYWIEINELLVSYGQRVCTPLSPHCSSCAFERHCPQIGVTRSR